MPRKMTLELTTRVILHTLPKLIFFDSNLFYAYKTEYKSVLALRYFFFIVSSFTSWSLYAISSGSSSIISGSLWNLEMLVFVEREKPVGVPGEEKPRGG